MQYFINILQNSLIDVDISMIVRSDIDIFKNVLLISIFFKVSFTILYQDNQGLIRLQELLKSSTDSDLRTVVHQLSFDGKDDNKKILREVKQSGFPNEIFIQLRNGYNRPYMAR